MKKFCVILFAFAFTNTVMAQNLTIYRSSMNVSETSEKIEEIIKKKGLIFFETVSHDKIAKEREFEISATNVILFEDPVLTSQLISCEQTSALDLPLKVLVWEEHGDVFIGYVDPTTMRRRFMINGCDDTLNQMAALIIRVVNEALRQG